jgi:hypothetical protein
VTINHRRVDIHRLIPVRRIARQRPHCGAARQRGNRLASSRQVRAKRKNPDQQEAQAQQAPRGDFQAPHHTRSPQPGEPFSPPGHFHLPISMLFKGRKALQARILFDDRQSLC